MSVCLIWVSSYKGTNFNPMLLVQFKHNNHTTSLVLTTIYRRGLSKMSKSTTSDQSRINLLDIPKMQLQTRLSVVRHILFLGHKNWVLFVAWSPDGKHLVSGSKSGEIQIYDPWTGKASGNLLTIIICSLYPHEMENCHLCKMGWGWSHIRRVFIYISYLVPN
uniref:Anaphase-promoting complex subunit 4 WD40 domain-containing protein n=1 Tax=Lactuca sativa TaxID=4236 RepID=A0A9R1UKF8_LACSA|nr:hypothetical protein LSAT_V11C800446270 [Lactuca sativa]